MFLAVLVGLPEFHPAHGYGELLFARTDTASGARVVFGHQ